MANHAVTVRAIVVSPSEDVDGAGTTEMRQTTAQFNVPLNGSETGWTLPFSAVPAFHAGTFVFNGPNVDWLVERARQEAREELLRELRQMSADELAVELREDTDDEYDDD